MQYYLVLIKLFISQVIETVHMEDDVFSCMALLPSLSYDVPWIGSPHSTTAIHFEPNHSAMMLCSISKRMLTALPVTGLEGSPLLLLGGSSRNFRTSSSCFQALQNHQRNVTSPVPYTQKHIVF